MNGPVVSAAAREVANLRRELEGLWTGCCNASGIARENFAREGGPALEREYDSAWGNLVSLCGGGHQEAAIRADHYRE